MDVLAVQSLHIKNKSQWLRSPAGLQQLKQWLTSGLSLCKIAGQLKIHDTTLCTWCEKYPELSRLTGRPLGGTPKVDHSRPASYRIIIGMDYSHSRGTVLSEYPTAQAVWQSDFIRKYFKSYGLTELDYLSSYLEKIGRDGIFQLSNTYCICFCEINHRGIIKILKSKP